MLRASPFRRTPSCRASTADDREPTSISSTASPYLQPEPGQLAYYPIIDAIQEFKIESNSPAAEFGRFNGGVVNLTTKSGTNALSGNVFEFFRNEHLNARNYFQKSNPVKPDYRRNQYGGMSGGPLVKDRTFFFGDYQGQRQSIGRTVTSNVPTLAERSGVFRQNIYDPATTVGNTRQPFPNNTIPRSAMDPVALSLVERYPLPTNTATANNYSRTANEVDDQDQGDVRIDHKFASGRDQLFGRLTHFRGHAEPVTAFPDGSGTILAGSVAVGPQETTSWAFASNYQHTFSPNLLNELRIGDTRRAVERSAVSLSSPQEPHSVFPAFRRVRNFLTPCRPSHRTVTSSSDPRITRPRTSAPASHRSPIRSRG